MKLFRPFVSLLGLALVSVFVVGCSSSPTAVNYDPSVDFSAYKTYAFLADMAENKEPYQSLEATYLKKALARELEKAGLQSTQTDPDLLINFSIETQEKVQSRSVPTGGYGVGYDPFYDVYGTGWGMGHTTRIDQYTEGRLVIDAIDVDSKKIVWQGSTKGRLTNSAMQNFEKTLDEAVTEIFAHEAKAAQ